MEYCNVDKNPTTMYVSDIDPLLSLGSINLYLNVYTMEVFEERISRFRNTPLLFDSFQNRQNFLPVVDTSSNIFLLVIEGVKVNSLVKKKE